MLVLSRKPGEELFIGTDITVKVLCIEGSRVRITLDPQGRAAGGTEFETVGVRLDSSGRIVEFILNSTAA